MIVVGLTGGMGSGKSTIAKYIKNKRIPVFDSDAEVKKLYTKKDEDLIKTIIKIDNNNEIFQNNKVNKKTLREIVFNNKKKLAMLEKIIFKKLALTRKAFLDKNKILKKRIVFLDTPLLYENKIDRMCDCVVVTKAPKSLRIKRVLKRKGMTKNTINNIISKQIPEKIRQKRADYIIDTKQGTQRSLKQADKILNNILKNKSNAKRKN